MTWRDELARDIDLARRRPSIPAVQTSPAATRVRIIDAAPPEGVCSICGKTLGCWVRAKGRMLKLAAEETTVAGVSCTTCHVCSRLLSRGPVYAGLDEARRYVTERWKTLEPVADYQLVGVE